MNSEDWIATYAAIVATGALFLEVRRWFESGPKIVVKASAGMTMVGLDGKSDENDLLILTAYNRGDLGSTVTHMIVLEYNSWWRRLIDKPSQFFIVPHPQPKGYPPVLPGELRPGGQWQGICRGLVGVSDIQSGRFWVGIHASNRDKPYLAHVRKKKEVRGTPV